MISIPRPNVHVGKFSNWRPMKVCNRSSIGSAVPMIGCENRADSQHYRIPGYRPNWCWQSASNSPTEDENRSRSSAKLSIAHERNLMSPETRSIRVFRLVCMLIARWQHIRMSSSRLECPDVVGRYADILMPFATWYSK